MELDIRLRTIDGLVWNVHDTINNEKYIIHPSADPKLEEFTELYYIDNNNQHVLIHQSSEGLEDCLDYIRLWEINN